MLVAAIASTATQCANVEWRRLVRVLAIADNSADNECLAQGGLVMTTRLVRTNIEL
jgi:hypothetical protein